MVPQRPLVASAWKAWADVSRRIRLGKRIVLDGGVGTLFEAKQVKMDEVGWCCASHIYAPDVALEVHKEYIQAGAEIITANTYAANRAILERNGLGPQTRHVISSAVEIAQKARDLYGNGRTLIAGSLSTHAPIFDAGSPQANESSFPPDDVLLDAYVEACNILAEAGVDFLFLEMMKEKKRSKLAIRAAAACGLPVFLGLSTMITPEGKVILFESGTGDGAPFTQEILKDWISLLKDRMVCVNVMHTNFGAMAKTLEVVRQTWKGPVGAYPDHGRFKSPTWEFEEVDIKESITLVDQWVRDYDVSIIGGCCGLKPDYIQAVAQYCANKNAAVDKPAYV